MPHVLFVHHRPQPSGAAQSLALLIEGLGKDWEAHVVVPGGGAAELFAAAGATVHRVPVPAFTHTWDVQYRGFRWLVALRELVSLPRHARMFKRLLRELHPAVVHLNDSVLVASALIAHRARSPVVWHLRSALPNGGHDRRSRWICGLIDKTGASAIAIDSDVAQTFTLTISVSVVPNVVVVRPGETTNLHVPDGHLAIGYVGYLRRQKGWPEFLRALRLLVDDGVRVHGVVVGGGVRPHSSFRGTRGRLLELLGVPDEELAFGRELDRLALQQHVTWLPFTSDIGSVYRGLDLVCFPNQGVGLGRPVLEAAAYGVPAIAAGSSGGAGLLVPGVTGVLLDRGDAASIAAAVRELVEDPAALTRLAEAAAAHAGQMPTPELAASRVQAAWLSAIG
jgi:glycosyltransferase involved in cell wall biosynthesis